MYLSTILDDFSRYIIAWKLCTTMKTSDVTDTLELALQASGYDQASVAHKPRLLSDNGSSYVSAEYCLRVALRMSLIAFAAPVCLVCDFCFIFIPLTVITMNQKSSLRQSR